MSRVIRLTNTPAPAPKKAPTPPPKAPTPPPVPTGPQVDPDVLAVGVRACLMKAFAMVDLNTTEAQCVLESIVAELEDSPPPANASEMRKRIEDLLVGQEEIGIEDEDFQNFFEILVPEVQAAFAADDDDDEEDLPEGYCPMCERPMPLTRHHLIPRTTHDWYGKRYGASKEHMAKTLDICRPCHSAVHRARTERELAVSHNTLDTIMELPEIQSFVQWAQKQKTRSKSDARVGMRYAK